MTKDNLSQRMNEMKTNLKHKDANIEIEKLPSGKNKITVKLLDNNLFMPYGTWETSYPVDLIEQILSLKGPASLCDEIMRDESIDYLQENLRYDVLSYKLLRMLTDSKLLPRLSIAIKKSPCD